jgi:nucleoside-diphosphate-sugar epimerase
LPLQILKVISARSAGGGEKKRIAFVNVDSFFNKSGNIYTPLINYSLSKKSLLDWLVHFSESIPVINMRVEHMYGPGDNDIKFIPLLMNKLLTPSITEIPLSPGMQIRDFIHVSDVSNAFALLLRGLNSHLGNGFTEYQIGTGVGTSIRELASRMKYQSGSKAILNFGAVPYSHKEIMSSMADSVFSQKFNWAYSISLNDGINNLFQSI